MGAWSNGPSGQDIFEILVREHAGMLTAHLRCLLDDSSAVDDLFQETMIVAWRRLADYDRSRPFGPWLRGIARRVVLSHYRARSREPAWCAPDVLDAIERRFAGRREDDVLRHRSEQLGACIQRLPAALREVVELVYGRGMLLREIAVASEVHEETVKKRLQRARALLLECVMHGGMRDE